MLYNATKDTVVLTELNIADSFFKRFIGLLGREYLRKGEGLMLVNCKSIHTFFMRFPIDIVFININHEIIYMKENVKPWRAVNFVKKAYATIEMPAGTIKDNSISNGDMLILK